MRRLFAVLTLLFLFGCGGGGSSPSSNLNGNGGNMQPVPVVPVVLDPPNSFAAHISPVDPVILGSKNPGVIQFSTDIPGRVLWTQTAGKDPNGVQTELAGELDYKGLFTLYPGPYTAKDGEYSSVITAESATNPNVKVSTTVILLN